MYLTDIENTFFMLPEHLTNSEHNSTFRNSEHISTLKTKSLLKYVPMLCAYNMIILNKCTRKRQNVAIVNIFQLLPLPESLQLQVVYNCKKNPY